MSVSQRYAADVVRPDAFLSSTSSKFSEAVRQVELLARFDHAVVLIEGEPGTGKTHLAKHLHNRSRRRDSVFHRVDLGALDDGLSGSDLFGHVSGAFTGAQSRRVGHFIAAQGGTLFLDELAKASKCVQQKLLHAIEYREVVQVGAERPMKIDVRLVAATNVVLEERVAAGEFLPDLLPRFGHFRVRIPPLRERRADILDLADHFIAVHSPAFGYDGRPVISAELAASMECCEWPGNVRELDSAVQYLLFTAVGAKSLELEHCTGSLTHLKLAARDGDNMLTPDRVRAVVNETGSISGAARKLGTARTTVYRYLRREEPGEAFT
jgi:DNA-binding NtrC family response regulator